MGLDAPPQGMELLARQAQLAGQAGGQLTFGHTAPQEYQRRWAVTGLFKDGVGQERIVAVTRAATGGREGALLPEEMAFGAMTVRVCEPIWMQVRRQPDEAAAIIQQFGKREIDRIDMGPHHAR